MVALASLALLVWSDEPSSFPWPRLLPPLLVVLGQLSWLLGRTWLGRGLMGMTLILVLALLASYLVPEEWVGFATWSAWYASWPGTGHLALQRPPLLWLITLTLLAINPLLQLRLGRGSPVMLAMVAILLGVHALAGSQSSAPLPPQPYIAPLGEQTLLWLVWLAQLTFLLPPLRQYGTRVLIPLAIGAGVALTSVLWWEQQQTQVDRHLYRLSSGEGQRLADFMSREIDEQLDAMRRFVSFWELSDQPPTRAHWQRQVAKYQDDYRYFQDIGFITPDGIIRWVYPVDTNRNIVGTRLFEAQPRGQTALRRTLVERREGQVGVVELLQGGKGMIYYLPIVSVSDDRLLGAASMVISLEMLIEVLLEQIDIDHIALTLSDDEGLLVRAGPPARLADWTHRYAIDVGAQTLQLVTRPSQAFLLQSRPRLPELTLVVGLLLAYLLYQLLYAQRRLGLQHRATQQANADLVDEIATRTRLQQEMEWMARHDELTALPNRRHFLEYVMEQEARLPLTIMICDIDHFKHVNDCLGHLVGDRYLKAFAEQARPVINAASGLFSRYGGEEFVACLPDCTANQGYEHAQALRRAMATAALRHEDGRPVTISIGVATIERGPLDIARLMQHADEALYRAKSMGRDRIVMTDAA